MGLTHSAHFLAAAAGPGRAGEGPALICCPPILSLCAHPPLPKGWGATGTIAAMPNGTVFPCFPSALTVLW